MEKNVIQYLCRNIKCLSLKRYFIPSFNISGFPLPYINSFYSASDSGGTAVHGEKDRDPALMKLTF